MLDPLWDVEDFSRTFELNFSRDICRLDQPQLCRSQQNSLESGDGNCGGGHLAL